MKTWYEMSFSPVNTDQVVFIVSVSFFIIIIIINIFSFKLCPIWLQYQIQDRVTPLAAACNGLAATVWHCPSAKLWSGFQMLRLIDSFKHGIEVSFIVLKYHSVLSLPQ